MEIVNITEELRNISIKEIYVNPEKFLTLCNALFTIAYFYSDNIGFLLSIKEFINIKRFLKDKIDKEYANENADMKKRIYNNVVELLKDIINKNEGTYVNIFA